MGGHTTVRKNAKGADLAVRALGSFGLVEAINRRVDFLVSRERFEDAALHRDRVATFLRAAARMQRLRGLTSIAEIARVAGTR